MARGPTSKLPAIVLVLVGLAIVTWSVPRIYTLTGSSGPWERIGLLVFVPALLLGLFDVGIGLLCHGDQFSIAGPAALLSGHVVLFGPFMLAWSGLTTPQTHPGFLLLGALAATGAVYLCFEVRRQLWAKRE